MKKLLKGSRSASVSPTRSSSSSPLPVPRKASTLDTKISTKQGTENWIWRDQAVHKSCVVSKDFVVVNHTYGVQSPFIFMHKNVQIPQLIHA